MTQERFISALVALCREQKKGVMDVRAEGVHAFLYISGGSPVYAEEDAVGETLGRMLVRKRMLTETQCDLVATQLKKSRVGNQQMRFGQVAVDLGFLTLDALEDALASQVKDKVVRCMQWEHPDWKFHASPGRLQGVGHYPVPLGLALLEAARSFEPARCEGILRLTEPFYPALNAVTTDIVARFGLTEPELQFLSIIDGKRTTLELLSGHAHDDVDKTSILTALVLYGDVALRPPLSLSGQGSRSMRPQESEGTRERLDVPRTSLKPPRPSLRPVSSVRPPHPQERNRAQHMLERVAKDREQPSLPEPLSSSGDGDQRLVAEQHFKNGKSMLRANLLHRALPEFRRAQELFPHSTEYRVYREWCEFRQLRDDDALAERARALKETALVAVRQNPGLAFGHYVLGHVALLTDDDAEANRRFRRALAIDPDTLDAEKHVRILAKKSGAHAVRPKVRRKEAGAPVTEMPEETIPLGAEPQDAVSIHDAPTQAMVVPSKNPPPAAKVTSIAPKRSRAPLVAVALVLLFATAGGVAYRWRARSWSSARTAAARVPAHAASAPAVTMAIATPSAASVAVIPSVTSSAMRPPSPTTSLSAAAAVPAPSIAPSAQSAAPAPPSAAPAPTSPSVASATRAAPDAIPEGMGRILTDGAPHARRIFVDNRVKAQTPEPVIVPCGTHKVKIGSSGREQSVDVPCGGEIVLTP